MNESNNQFYMPAMNRPENDGSDLSFSLELEKAATSEIKQIESSIDNARSTYLGDKRGLKSYFSLAGKMAAKLAGINFAVYQKPTLENLIDAEARLAGRLVFDEPEAKVYGRKFFYMNNSEWFLHQTYKNILPGERLEDRVWFRVVDGVIYRSDNGSAPLKASQDDVDWLLSAARKYQEVVSERIYKDHMSRNDFDLAA